MTFAQLGSINWSVTESAGVQTIQKKFIFAILRMSDTKLVINRKRTTMNAATLKLYQKSVYNAR